MGKEKPGAALCDQCGRPKVPQTHVGYSIMLCDECLESTEADDHMCPWCGGDGLACNHPIHDDGGIAPNPGVERRP